MIGLHREKLWSRERRRIRKERGEERRLRKKKKEEDEDKGKKKEKNVNKRKINSCACMSLSCIKRHQATTKEKVSGSQAVFSAVP